jgi:hypothetical protein
VNPEAMSETASGTVGKQNLFSIALIIGLAGVALALFGVWDDFSNGNSRKLFSWIIGLAFWMSVAIGMLFMILFFHIFKATWPIVIRRQLEHCMTAFPVLALLFLPLIFIAHSDDDMPTAHSGNPIVHDEIVSGKDGSQGTTADAGVKGEAHHVNDGHGPIQKKRGLLWKWMALDGEPHHDVLLEKKEAYLNRGMFTLRFVIYFVVFCGLGLFFRHASFSQDKDGDAKWTHISIKLACVGIIATALSTTFAAIDWFKAIEHHWFSTMYGVWYFAASMRAALAMTVIICFFLSTRGNLKGLHNQAHRYDLGVLMFAFTIFWAYITFSQFFLIYNADIPEETFWYNIRQFNPDNPDVKNSWYPIGMCLIFCNFLFPFFYLLFYRSKIVAKRALFIAGWILFWQLADIYYNILPGIDPNTVAVEGAFDYTVRQFSFTGFDFASLVGIGGLCAAAFFWSRGRSEPIPICDPRILECINHHE